MHKIYILNLIVWSSLSIVLTEASRYSSSCRTWSNDTGTCVPLSDCEFLKNITIELRKGINSSGDARSILQQSQCGYDNTQTQILKRVLVCCNLEQTSVTNNFVSRFGDVDIGILPGNVLPQPGICGRFIENKIVGGNVTQIDEYPWMALLFYKNSNNTQFYLCGGSLINSRYVLTAAHCINGITLPEGWTLFHVRLGEWDLNQSPHLGFDIERKIVHELYDRTSNHQLYDIALLRLASAVSYNLFVKPICLPLTQRLDSAYLKGKHMEVAGWGQTETQARSTIKLKANLIGWSLEDCFRKYKIFNFTLNESQICAGGEKDVDSCGGDSGGPLMIKEGGVYFIAGIVSYGYEPCGRKDWPSVNTNVGSFIDWIQNHLDP